MHNLKGRQTAELDTFSGTITLASPEDLPEGGSPRNQNMDFNVGSAFTRAGLVNPFIYANSALGPNYGNEAVDTPQGLGIPWTGIGGMLSGAGAFAQATLPAPTLNITEIQVLVFTQPHPLPLGFALLVTFDADVPQIYPPPSYSFSGVTGYTALNGQILTPPTNPPIGAAADQQVFIFGNTTYGPASDTGTAIVGLIQPTDYIDITEFAFSAPSTASPQGFGVNQLGYSSLPGATLHVQLLKAGAAFGGTESVPLPVNNPAIVTAGGINDSFDGTWVYSDLNSTGFGVRLWASSTVPGNTIYLSGLTLTCYTLPTQENFNYVATFEDSFGNIKTIALDAEGDFWVENVTQNPGTLMPLFSGPPAGSFAASFTADSRQYLALSDLSQGTYPPQQYTGQWNDRVSQVGPGAAPVFTGIAASSTTYAISTITQPPDGGGHGPWDFSYFLQSSGTGATDAGNVVTAYYADFTAGAGVDTDLLNAFNAGYAVYLFVSFNGTTSGGASFSFGPQVVQVTNVSSTPAQPPGQPHQFFYFTFNVTNVASVYCPGSGHPGNVFDYQRTLASLTMSEPVPGVTVGSTVTISGVTPSSWDGTPTITQTLNSGAFEITETVVSGGVATYSYNLVTGSVPTAGQLVTITGTDNANGQLNVNNAPIVSASGGASGTFTLNVSVGDFAAAAEEGQATTAGTQFAFDPGAALVGSATSPIHGTGTGGELVFAGTTQLISPGTRKAVVFFITRNGYWTCPSPFVTFDCPNNTLSIQASNLPIGPPDVIARAVAFTEAGANNVPGGNYYTLPDPVQYIVDGTTYTTSSLFINDNTTTTATFTFTDSVLLNAEEIDIQGNDLFNLGEIGDAAWCTQYAGRTVWGRVRTVVPNFLNLSFDGGYLANPGGSLLPLGWQLVNGTGTPTLLVSPVFGNSLYMSNQTGTTQTTFCMLFQSAYQDQNNVAILQNQTAYSVRISCRTPSGATGGALVVDLTTYSQGTGFGQTFGGFTLNLSSMTSAMATYEGALLTTETLNIPANLVLRVWGQNIPPGADIEIDRLTVFPTEEPTNLTQLTLSYASDPESFDLDTGGIDTTTVNAQPANGAFTMHDTLYIVKESSLGYVTDSPNQEPANWNPYKEVSNVAGACGINAYDVGEEWAVMACQNGLFLFNGGAPTPIQLEIPDIWQAINWSAGQTICVRNDVANRKIYCAIPLPTPNPWMVDATVNANPTTPNVILAMDYKGVGTIEELMAASAMHVTMMGKLAVHDLRRKWSLWTIPTPYIGQVKRNELQSLMMFCNGIQSSKIYYLGAPNTGKDDGTNFTSSYCTYGFINQDKEEANPMFGLWNKRFVLYGVLANGSGTADLTFYQNVLGAPYPYDVPGGITLSNPAANDYRGPLNEYATRLFLEMVMEEGWFNLSRLTLAGAADRFAPI